MANANADVDGTYGLTAAAFSECPECGAVPVGFVTVDDPDASILNTHVAAGFSVCTSTTPDATRVVFHERTADDDTDTETND